MLDAFASLLCSKLYRYIVGNPSGSLFSVGLEVRLIFSLLLTSFAKKRERDEHQYWLLRVAH